MADEAGFDVLIGSEETQLPSAMYSERVYVMSKVFIKTALTNPPRGLADIIQWLYLSSQPGPHLLRRVFDDSRKLLDNNTTVNTDGSASGEMGDGGFTVARLSTGASIVLKRHVDWMEDFMKRHEEGIVRHAS